MCGGKGGWFTSSGVDIQCNCLNEGDCVGTENAYTFGHVYDTANLVLCPQFWKDSKKIQFDTILHEMTHYGGSYDAGKTDFYYNDAKQLEQIIPWVAGLFPGSNR